MMELSGPKVWVTQASERHKNISPANTVIYACGPKEMLKSLAKNIK